MWTCRGMGQQGLKHSWVKFVNRSLTPFPVSDLLRPNARLRKRYNRLILNTISTYHRVLIVPKTPPSASIFPSFGLNPLSSPQCVGRQPLNSLATAHRR